VDNVGDVAGLVADLPIAVPGQVNAVGGVERHRVPP
jgi:hypothetical protein